MNTFSQQLAAKCGGNDALRNPEHLIHLEKLRVMEVEKAQLLEAIEKAKEENNMLQEQLKLKTQEATQDIQRVQQMLGQLDQACNFAKDYAICP
jgi:DNA mismatch repair ATPase MutS